MRYINQKIACDVTLLAQIDSQAQMGRGIDVQLVLDKAVYLLPSQPGNAHFVRVQGLITITKPLFLLVRVAMARAGRIERKSKSQRIIERLLECFFYNLYHGKLRI